MQTLELKIETVQIVSTNLDRVYLTIDQELALHGEFQQFNENTLEIRTPVNQGADLVRMLGWTGDIEHIRAGAREVTRGEPSVAELEASRWGDASLSHEEIIDIRCRCVHEWSKPSEHFQTTCVKCGRFA